MPDSHLIHACITYVINLRVSLEKSLFGLVSVSVSDAQKIRGSSGSSGRVASSASRRAGSTDLARSIIIIIRRMRTIAIVVLEDASADVSFFPKMAATEEMRSLAALRKEKAALRKEKAALRAQLADAEAGWRLAARR